MVGKKACTMVFGWNSTLLFSFLKKNFYLSIVKYRIYEYSYQDDNFDGSTKNLKQQHLIAIVLGSAMAKIIFLS